MRYASPIVQKYKRYINHTKVSSREHPHKTEKTQGRLIEDFIQNHNPRYKLRAEENIVHDSFG